MQELIHRTLVTNCIWVGGSKATVAEDSGVFRAGCRVEGRIEHFFMDTLNLSYLQHQGATGPEAVKEMEEELKAEDRVPCTVRETVVGLNLGRKVRGKWLRTEPWGRPGSVRKKKKQWRYQRGTE